MGVDPNKKERRPEDEILGFWPRLLMGAVFASLYIATFGPRTGWLPGIISGIMGGVVVFLLLREVEERRKRRMRRNGQHRR
jgi:uncharacterized membrane protein YdjX (TVP38/TMEM64 family)